ncbi:unnamed protein product [Adineta ricciae]|uniref:Uncharacterized protein n=1 Tax=Adineta ricciae TaxID=249248 RepID=A0A816FWP5_ADIRI|nr:unnamed protein product [Adineta ricciae]
MCLRRLAARSMKSQAIIVIYDIHVSTIHDQPPFFSVHTFICHSNDLQCNVVFAFHNLCIDFVKTTDDHTFSLMFLYPEITINEDGELNAIHGRHVYKDSIAQELTRKDLMHCIQYDEFVCVEMIYHEICSSDFRSQQWFNYLYDDDQINERNFRSTASTQFQSLGSLCKLTRETIDTSLTQFYATKLITSQLLSNEIFQNRIHSLITLQKTTSQSFKRTLNIIEEILHGNSYMSVYQTNWKFTILERENFSPIYTNPMKYQSCSCGTSSLCCEPVIIDNSIIDGLFIGCYPMKTILQSSLQYFYNETCLQIILSYFQKIFFE